MRLTKALTATFLAMLTATATADPRHILVLRAEGSADAATRGRVDAQIGKLAKTLDGNVEVGEITFTDAAAAVGCSGNEAQCRDDVLGMMGVDELISTSVTTMPSGDIRVLVHRIPKGAATKDAQSTIPTGQPLDTKIATDVGPMFGVKSKPGAATTACRRGRPSVNVPVLSMTSVSIFSSCSSASARRNKMPTLAPRPVPTMIDIGVARPSAHGQAMISTATAFTSACANRGSGPQMPQIAAVASATSTTLGTNQPDATSASR